MVVFNIADTVKQISASGPEMVVKGFRKKSSGYIKPGPQQPKENKSQVICEWQDEKTKELSTRVFDAGMLVLVGKAV